MPMILETSIQAQFLIPMALSLGYGVLFATVVTLLFTPSMYVILEDVKLLIRFKLPRHETAAYSESGTES
jgi:hypothetical protein